mmetsp:Transcript_13794/g.16750  ORF Transcript_13794/g.16750 Transcript_13794/m.16750 type:complete len:299 (+) Transcript_13794:106-1002(+)
MKGGFPRISYVCFSIVLRFTVGNDLAQECYRDGQEAKGINEECTTWRWDLDENHVCNIKKLTFKELHELYENGLPPLYHEPLVLYNDDERADKETQCVYSKFVHMTSFENITQTLPQGFEVTLSSSNSFSAHRRTIPLVEYLQETYENEVLPFHLSNATWYLFGETYSETWMNILNEYCLPPCQTCTKDLSALSFGIGGKGSGVQWHVHGPGFSQSLHGRKHWILYPPDQKPIFDPDFTSRHWMEEIYTPLPQSKLPYECTLYPGEMVYFPDKWYHATLNLDHYTAFVSTFTTEHGFS